MWKIIPIKLFAQPVQKSWMLRLHVNNLQNFLLHRRTESESQRRRKHFKLHLRRFPPPLLSFFPPLFFFLSEGTEASSAVSRSDANIHQHQDRRSHFILLLLLFLVPGSQSAALGDGKSSCFQREPERDGERWREKKKSEWTANMKLGVFFFSFFFSSVFL